jgi:hypothetical protein
MNRRLLKMSNRIIGTVTIIIYFPVSTASKKNYIYPCRIFLENSIPKYLQDYTKEIRPLIFSIIKLSGFKTLKTVGCQYIYNIKDATPEFFEKLYDFLDKKKRKNEFLDDYSVIFGHFIDKESFY